MTSTTISVLIGVAALAFVVYRQLRVRKIKFNLKISLIFAILGVLQTVQYLHSGGPVEPGSVAAVLAAMIIAAVLALPRAKSLKIWRAATGEWMGRGTWVTLALWVCTVGLHVAVSLWIPPLFGDAGHLLGGLEQATLMIYVAVTIGLQNYLQLKRLDNVHQHDALIKI